MLQNITTSSAIEGEQLNVGSVRSSLAKRLGVVEQGRTTARSEGLAELLLDTTQAHQQPLNLDRLFTWHRWLFPNDDALLGRPLLIGALCGHLGDLLEKGCLVRLPGGGRSTRYQVNTPQHAKPPILS